MRITVLYFAGLREHLSCAREVVDAPAAVQSLGDLRRWLAARGGAWIALQSMPNLRMALDQSMASAEAELAEGAEVAFFPPVTGG